MNQVMDEARNREITVDILSLKSPLPCPNWTGARSAGAESAAADRDHSTPQLAQKLIFGNSDLNLHFTQLDGVL